MEALRALCARGCPDAREHSPEALTFASASCLFLKVLQHASFPSGISFLERAVLVGRYGSQRPRCLPSCLAGMGVNGPDAYFLVSLLGGLF